MLANIVTQFLFQYSPGISASFDLAYSRHKHYPPVCWRTYPPFSWFSGGRCCSMAEAHFSNGLSGALLHAGQRAVMGRKFSI